MMHKIKALTGNDVHSIGLTKEESAHLRKRYWDNLNAFSRTRRLEYDVFHKRIDEAYELAAKEAGFEQFEANETCTGVRNYTAFGKFPNKEIAKKLRVFTRLQNEYTQPIFDKFRIMDESYNKGRQFIEQEYLQKIKDLCG